MRSQFSLFQTPLDFTELMWSKLLSPEDSAIDATCGNGHDTLKLAKFCNTGVIFAFDIQEVAIKNTQKLLEKSLDRTCASTLKFYHSSNTTMGKFIDVETVKLIVYNLGYLPGGDKSLTTQTRDTLESIERALPLVIPGGAISITCYPGHDEGAKEEFALVEYCKSLHPKEWAVSHHQWCNRNKSPSVLFLQKAI